MLSLQEIEATGRKASAAFTPDFVKVQQYLLERGITTDTIDKAQIQIYQAKDIFEKVYNTQSFDDRLAIVFKHFDLTGNPIPWWSSRLVETTPPRISFVKRGKMFCPPNEAPHGYLAPLTDFGALCRGDTVYIHESCIKALNGSRLGYHSIGLNGVYGFTSRKHKIDLVEEIRDLPWKQLELQCKIVFDSNAADNPNIAYAITMLAERLHRIHGVRATHLLLPKALDGQDQGFDDFVVRRGDAEAKAFLEQDGEAVAVSEVEILKAQLNDECAVVRALGRIANQRTGSLMNRAVFTDTVYAHYTAKVEDGEKLTIVNVPRLWLADKSRTSVESLDYMPGKERIFGDKLNLWRGMGLHPIDGNVQPFFELLVNNVEDQAIVRWLFQWLAYPLQNPGAKLNTYLHIFGQSGTGKNMVLRPLERIYGPNFVMISRDNLKSDFNSVYAAKQLVHVDELHGGDQLVATAIAQKIKMLVTGTTIVVNQKGQPEYVIRNFANMILTSNYYDSIKLDDDDRRACVVRFENMEDKRGDQDYWMEYVDWCDNGGAEALYQYLLEYDMDGFDPAGWAPHTKWKDLVTDASRSPLERWVHDLAISPDEIIPMNMMNKCLFTSKELSTLFYSLGGDELRKGQIDAMGKALRNGGFEMANEGSPVKVAGTLNRYWVVKERTRTWDHSECVRHFGLK